MEESQFVEVTSKRGRRRKNIFPIKTKNPSTAKLNIPATSGVLDEDLVLR